MRNCTREIRRKIKCVFVKILISSYAHSLDLRNIVICITINPMVMRHGVRATQGPNTNKKVMFKVLLVRGEG